ncbi:MULTISPECIES: putative quinol monooxygenase [Streptomyces]|uniref:Antibiotic biosynthesis monooxygenase family protein n=1 Tax=Streptomyces solicathayae TaxID=3081768 RepID=A0ABZ0LX04_9ACTN|nr:antibiotic biosynthesis monooxygenase family protein [Streptomyces sp. HUAS YS2]WOX24024.1 antibiotic biosynthesis monooxygenase family protein [Streptomyces sp. HUAS YS2]
MTEDSKFWASGNWRVSEGKEDEFVERWTAFLTWTKKDNEGFRFARLIRDAGEPGHFISFASWSDEESMAAWKTKPEFGEHFGACKALCDEMRAGSYVLAVSV